MGEQVDGEFTGCKRARACEPTVEVVANMGGQVQPLVDMMAETHLFQLRDSATDLEGGIH